MRLNFRRNRSLKRKWLRQIVDVRSNPQQLAITFERLSPKLPARFRSFKSQSQSFHGWRTQPCSQFRPHGLAFWSFMPPTKIWLDKGHFKHNILSDWRFWCFFDPFKTRTSHHDIIRRYWGGQIACVAVLQSARQQIRPIRIFGPSQCAIYQRIMLLCQHFQGQTSSSYHKGFFESVSRFFGARLHLFRHSIPKIRFYGTKTRIIEQQPLQTDQFNNQM